MQPKSAIIALIDADGLKREGKRVMKRTIKIALLTCLVLLVCVPMFTACNITDVKNYIDEIIPDRILPGETSEHVWSEWITIKEATCEEKGLLQRYCTECYYTESKPIDELGHTEVIDSKAVAPSCTEAGLTESKLCSVCDKVLAVQTVIDALGHIEVVDSAVAPTCIKAGLAEGKHCSVCNKVLVAQTIVEALGHSETIVAGVAPTCTEAGLSASKYCLVCGEVLIKQVVIEAKGHSFGEWITTKEPSEIEEGLMKRVCWCGEEETQIIEKLQVSTSFEYTLNNDGTSYSVTGIGSCTDTDIIIPNIYNGVPVTRIGNYAFEDCTGLTSVTIPNSVTRIDDYAFSGCDGLTNIIIPDSVKSIGASAFKACTELTSITIPNSVTSIGYSVFYGCSNLTSITISNNATSIGGYAFYSCSNLTCVTIPSSITSIGSFAFYDCSSLTRVTIPNSVESIGDYAFYGCRSLTSVTIPSSTKSIGNHVFSGCSSLASVTIPNSVTSIGSYAFASCFKLTRITIPDSVIKISNYAFYGCSSLVSVTFAGAQTWYRAYNYNDWYNRENGTSTSMANASTNATYLSSKYSHSYWYR